MSAANLSPDGARGKAGTCDFSTEPLLPLSGKQRGPCPFPRLSSPGVRGAHASSHSMGGGCAAPSAAFCGSVPFSLCGGEAGLNPGTPASDDRHLPWSWRQKAQVLFF